MKEAIQKSIEGGWNPKPALQYTNARLLIKEDIITLDGAFNDILFWQALGKSLKWADVINGRTPVWLYQWHEFIEHLAMKKDPDDFFKELLK